jgi:hypothetical protein
MAEQRSRLSPRYTWSAATRRYRDTVTGQLVPEATVQAAVEATLQRSQAELQRLGARLGRRELTVDEWQARVAAELKTIHLVPAAAARGGWGHLSQADYGFVGARVKEQLGFLRGFAADLKSGKQAVDARFTIRTGMYAEAGRGTYAAMQRRLARQGGATEERNVLGRADHCHGTPEGCIEQRRLGWVPLGTLVAVGRRRCLTRCRCRVVYR